MRLDGEDVVRHIIVRPAGDKLKITMLKEVAEKNESRRVIDLSAMSR